MDLYQRVRDAYRTGGVDVESNKDERTMVVFSILPDIFALHCSHVSAKRDWRAQSGTGAQPADLRVNDHTVEITDFGRIIDLRESCWHGRQGIVMNRDSGYRAASRDGLGFRTLLLVCIAQPGNRELRRDCQACRTGGRAQESSPRQTLAT